MTHQHGLLFDLDGIVYCAKCGNALPEYKVVRDFMRYAPNNVTYVKREA